ncbi:ELOVL fatty acid elongase 8b isoform X1 [Phyllopteryx taeniolatus]|uniref:ELOVL fatty acid elongase 8b isoform X1 n=1 Tax=Phyllopteryx taeniolatus TaxID=161469 RepID=UPI002AD4AFAF|nr:ELOVL fatty acid elongase 8b isoform X1 [Phyllopteryx taeniolatus]XP_061636445.1 ELOVL fatty acid elongase 8b isoform X1 [Phyllopteryx taeniolatus]
MTSAWDTILSAHQNIVDNGDKRTDPWPLVYSPVPVTLIVLVYLCAVWAGPRLMRCRDPADLRTVLVLYNLTMVAWSAYMFHEFLATSWLSNYSLLCQPVDYSDRPLAMRMARVCWWFFFSKVIELSDTLIFILRKKNGQVTFLHVFHHATMIFNWWSAVKYTAGGQSRLTNARMSVSPCSFLHRPAQHFGAHRDVLLLRPGCSGPSHAQVPVVEVVPHLPAAAAVSADSHARDLQPVHPMRLPGCHQHRGGCLLHHPHRPLRKLLSPKLPGEEEAEVRCIIIIKSNL